MTEDAAGTRLLSTSLIFVLGSGSPHHVLSTEETEAGTENLESPEGLKIGVSLPEEDILAAE